MARSSALWGPRTDSTTPASIEVLLHLAGPNPSADGDSLPILAGIDGAGGRSLLAAARRHALLPLVAHRLARLLPPAPSTPFRDLVLAERRAAAARSLVRVAALAEVLGRFRRRGIEALAFKGPALAARLHGDPALRDFEDLDLLVRPRDLPAARAALEGLGYRQAFPLPAAARKTYGRVGCELPFGRGDGSLVDLHWGLFPRFFRFPLEREGIWESARTVDLGGLAVRAPRDDHHLLLLAFHGGKSLWARLGWVADLARFLSLEDAPDPREVRRLAVATGSERALAVGIRLAAGLSGAAVPDGWEDPSPDPEAVRLADHFARGLRAPEPPGEDFRGRFDLLLRLRERPSDRWHLLLGLSFVPAPADWVRVVRCPPLLPLLGGVRTVRSAARHGLRAAGGRA